MVNIFSYLIRFFLCLFILCSSSLAFSKALVNHNNYSELPLERAVPGGIIKLGLNISPAINNANLPKAYFNNVPVLVYLNSNKYYALVGLGLDIKPGIHRLKYIYNAQEKYKNFQVHAKKYAVSRIKIKDQNMVNPDEKTQLIIAQDQAKINLAVNNYRDLTPDKLVLKQPVKGFLTTSFGARRIINGLKKNAHSGMDIAADEGSPVYSAGNGKVILADNFYYSGNMIAVDHGGGLITMYAHLSEILVKVGAHVTTKKLIAKVGSTGRVTGPHLHWTVRLNQVAVDPALFLFKSA